MLEDYRTLAVFVEVAEAGSFAEAGRILNLSTSVISHHISRLEEKLGVSLFFRSTRSMSLTPEGLKMLESARQMVASGQEAMDALADIVERPVGELRLAMPAFGVETSISQRVWTFAREHPLITITLHSSDTQVDIIDEGFDLALRFGDLTDDAMKSCRVSDFRHVLVATPRFLHSQPPIRTIADLRSMQFISYSMLPDEFSLIRGNETINFTPEKMRVELNSLAAVKSAILNDLGIQRLPETEVRQELREGALERVLPEWSLPESGVYAVWPEVGRQKNLTRRFIEYLRSDE